jgi:SAM-dependent methyltransferase
MMGKVRKWLNRFPRLKALLRWVKSLLIGRSSVSSHFVRLSTEEVTSESTRLRSSWQADELPAKQRQLVDPQLEQYRAGQRIEVFDVLVDAIRRLPVQAPSGSVLEIGCSSGFYSEVFSIAKLPLHYAGCDYSSAFIDLARKTYPDLPFEVEDATSLRYPDASFDIVISGCCLLHIPEYETAIAETVRVSKAHAIFHRTPVLPGHPTTHFRKLAYGVETVEIHFGEAELKGLFAKHGLEILEIETMDEDVRQGVLTAVRTYVCRRASS